MKKVRRIFIAPFVIGGLLLVNACGEVRTSETTNVSTSASSLSEVGSVSELVKNYQTEVMSFLEDTILKKMVEYSTNEEFEEDKLVEATFDLADGKNVSVIRLAFTYKQENNIRNYYVNEATLSSPISLNELVSYSKGKTEVNIKMIKNIYTFAYNAYKQYIDKDFVEAIFKKAASTEKINNRFMYANPRLVENENFGGEANRYEFLEVKADGVYQYSFDTVVSTKQATILENMSMGNYQLYNENKVFEFSNSLIYKEYKEEAFDSFRVKNVEELFTTYKKETDLFLEACYNKIILKANINSDITLANWAFTDRENLENLNKLTLVIAYKDSSETSVLKTIDFTLSDILLEQIAKYSENKEDVDSQIASGNIKEVSVVNVNGKEGFLKYKLVNALINKANLSKEANIMFSDLGVVNNKQQYALNVVNTNGIETYLFNVESADSDEKLITNIKNGFITYSNIAYSFIEIVPQSTIEYSVDNIEEAILYFEDQINLNLKSAHDSIFDPIKTRNKEEVSFRWDLGEVDENGNITNLKLNLKFSAGSITEYFRVYNLTLNNPVSVNDLLNENTMKNISFKSDRIYSTSYDKSIQGTKDALIDAIAKVAITDGYDYDSENVTKIYINDGNTTDSTYGVISRIQIILISKEGVRHQSISIKSSDSDAGLIKQIEQGNYRVYQESLKSVDFSSNILNEHTPDYLESLTLN